MSAGVYVALVHHPVRDRDGEIVTSAITNVDVHDLARSARTYGLAGYYVVSPIAAQREIVERILEHWQSGAGARRVPERSVALALVRAVASIDDALEDVRVREARDAGIVVTAARAPEGRALLAWDAAREVLDAAPTLLLFGTAHGLHASVIERAAHVLAPIDPGHGWNHLSVRAAAAITLDRLFGR